MSLHVTPTALNKPALSIRGINICESLLRHTPEQIESLLDRMAAWKFNTLLIHDAYGFRKYGALISSLCADRSIRLVHYLQTSLVFLEGVSPDRFAKNASGDPLTPTLCNESRLCVSDPVSVECFREGARRFFSKVPGDHLSTWLLMDADGYGYCQCANCARLGPVEQWNRLFPIAIDEARATGKPLVFWYLSYVWRYRLPADLRPFDHVEAVLFDTHQRCRWAPMGEPHALSVFNELEAEADPVARETPLNVYLADRLADWRRAFSGKVVVFENLMLQGSISCPQPYTPQLLSDIEHYRSNGVDGLILEAFEPGIQSFARQIDALAGRMLNPQFPVTAQTRIEQACAFFLRKESPQRFNYKNQFNVLAWLTSEKFDGVGLLRDHLQDDILLLYATHLRAFLLSRSSADCARVVLFALDHKARLDWVMIAFNLLRAIEPPLNPCESSPLLSAIRFLTHDKLWDWMEPLEAPLDEADKVIRSILECRREPI